jgi:hypothetical protein
LLGKRAKCATSSLTTFLQTVLNKKYGILGIALAIQSFGDYSRWHPHLHALVADGLFTESGYFYVMPKVDLRPLAELFRAAVLKMLQKEGRIDESFIKMIMAWRHNSGFSVHNEVRILPGDSKGIENLAQYIIGNTFSLGKMSYIESTGTVIYRSKMSHGTNKKNFQTFSALEFIAAITQHIPDRLMQICRYYGWYSNRMRGDRNKAEKAGGEAIEENIEAMNEVIVVSGFKPKKIPQLMWRECIKKIWEVDPLLCPHCGSLMKLISFIYQHKVIRKILDHLGLFEETKQQRERAPPCPEVIERIIEQFDDGWPDYAEPFIAVKTL